MIIVKFNISYQILIDAGFELEATTLLQQSFGIGNRMKAVSNWKYLSLIRSLKLDFLTINEE